MYCIWEEKNLEPKMKSENSTKSGECGITWNISKKNDAKILSDTIKRNAFKFLQQAKLLHNNKYDYTNVVYIGSNSQVKIKCPFHGLFLQRPRMHLIKTLDYLAYHMRNLII